MAIFGKSDKKGGFTNETTLISQQCKIKGEFELKTNLHIDGEVEGIIECRSTVSIGKNGKLTGEIRAVKLLVNGIFFGQAQAETIEIMSGGRLIGDVVAGNLIIHDCAIFEGSCKHEEPKEAQKSSS